VIDEVLALTDMEGRKNDLISGLSRGMQQRTSLARVLVNDPDLLLLDEPASGLDPRARIELMEILKALRSMGKTIFISSHILPELAELCDSVTIIDKGKVMYSGSMSGLQTSTNEHPTWRVTFGSVVEGIIDRIKGLPGVVNVDQVEGRPDCRVSYDWTETDTNTLLKGLLELGAPIVGFTEDKRHLNDAFMDLTTKGVK
jgi:ABC-2 type transport system ATP-binding protein